MLANNRSATTRRYAGWRAIACAAVLLPAMLMAPGVAQAGCVTRLPVEVSRPDGLYAAAYAKQISLRVAPGVPRIRNLRAELYTFTGELMGATRPRRLVRRATTLKLRLKRLFAPLQAGGFTLVVTGEPNSSRSCGPRKSIRVLKFRGCRVKLPVTFPKLPGGLASDYRDYLSVPVRSSSGTVIRDLHSAVFGFDGSSLGTSPPLASLFGEHTLDHKLAGPLAPGSYSVVVDGRPADQPDACGVATAKAVMTFR